MIETTLTNEPLRERLVAEAREHVLKFDWAEVARETARVYDELVAAAAVSRV
jgi:glycogen(starch) synthase